MPRPENWRLTMNIPQRSRDNTGDGHREPGR